MSIMAIAVIIVVLLLHIILHRIPGKYLYLMWIIVGIRLVCPYAVSSHVSIFNVVRQDIRSGVEEKRELQNNDGPLVSFSSTDSPHIVQETSYKPPSVNKTGEELQPSAGKPVSHLARYGAGVWVLGMVLILLWNIFAGFRLKRNLKKAVRYQGNIYECDNIPSPFVMGILHPRIYIPFRLEEEERSYILKHEQHHIRRGDHVVKLLAFLLVCVYWFHPLVWLSYFLMIQDMEMSCDEYVLQMVPEDIRASYSRSLLGFAMNQRRMTAGCLSFGETNVRKRVQNVMNFKKPVAWVRIAAVLVLIAAGVACLTNAMGNDSKNENSTDGKIAKENSSSDSRIGKEYVLEPYEAVVAGAQIHGYELQFVYSPSDEKQTVMDDLQMYDGDFELRTSKDNILCARLPFKSEETSNYFPVEGFDLIVKDYDGDGNKDDFFIGQGQFPDPVMGNCMAYWLYTVGEDGSIKQYSLSGNLLTMPNYNYSGDFEYKEGKIRYQGLGTDGNDGLQAEEVTSIVRDSSHLELGSREEASTKAGQDNKETEKEYEVVVAQSQIHGYELRLVYSPKDEKIRIKNGMYEGEFELRTYKDNIFCQARKIPWEGELYYPEKGFDLALKDYDGDGDANDFSIGQGETIMPKDGRSMVYWFFSVREDGSIIQYQLDNEEEDYLRTVPSYNFSKEFDCYRGKISYMGFDDKGAQEMKTTEVTSEMWELS